MTQLWSAIPCLTGETGSQPDNRRDHVSDLKIDLARTACLVVQKRLDRRCTLSRDSCHHPLTEALLQASPKEWRRQSSPCCTSPALLHKYRRQSGTGQRQCYSMKRLVL